MNERIEKLRALYDKLAIRERALVLVALLGASYGLVDMILLHPMDLERDRLRAAIANVEDSVVQANAQIQLLGEQIQNGMPTGVEAERRALQQQIDVMNARINERLSSMIRPDEVARMLEALLSKESELELVSLSSVDPNPGSSASKRTAEVVSNESAGEKLDVTEFYRHAFVIQLEGTYLATLHYLESIEGLPWGLSWDRITYEVTEYPRARISIELHTLSREENWIGV